MFCHTKLRRWISHAKGCKRSFCHMKRQQVWCQKEGTEPSSKVKPMNCRTAERVNKLFIITQVHENKNSHLCWKQMKDTFYSTDVIFVYEYFMTSSYEITNKSHFVIQTHCAPYNCPLICQLKNWVVPMMYYNGGRMCTIVKLRFHDDDCDVQL
jgi:hypothetical protein